MDWRGVWFSDLREAIIELDVELRPQAQAAARSLLGREGYFDGWRSL